MAYPTSNAIPISGPIGLNSEFENIPTHFDELGQGGFRAVLNITALHAIITARRAWGMLVYVRSESKYYKLCNTDEGGASYNLFDNNNWIQLNNSLIVICPAGLQWQGVFDDQETYVVNDVVQYTDPGTGVTATYWAVSSPSGTPTDINGDPNSAGGWQLFSAVGPQGPDGDDGGQGERGSLWYTGTTTPDLAGIVGVQDGDYYLHLPENGNDDPANGDVYIYQLGDWVDAPVGNIQGPDGVDGGGTWPFGTATTTAAISNSGFSSAGQSLVGLTAFQILQKLLFPYSAPTLGTLTVWTQSTAASGENQPTNVIIGTQLSGIRYFKTPTTNPTNFVANSFKITQEQTGQSGLQYIYGSATQPSAPVPASNSVFVTTLGSEININTVQFTVGGSYVKWTARALSNQNPNQSIMSTTPYQVYWRYPVYFGVSTSSSLSEAGVQGLTSVLKESQNGDYIINYNNPTGTAFLYIAYPVTGDEFSNFTNITKFGQALPFGLIPTASAGSGLLDNGADDFNVPDGSGKFYKPITLNIGPVGSQTPVDYRLYRSSYDLSVINTITIS